MDAETTLQHRVSLETTPLAAWRKEATVLDHGAILIGRSGEAWLNVNFDRWCIGEGSVITLFPNDVVSIGSATDRFLVEMLSYDASLLREASLQLEQTVYSQLRQDRCRSASPIVSDIINNMFALLKVYFSQHDCQCTEQLVLLQLKAFFLGFYDHLLRHPAERPEETGTRRVRELFNRFMQLVEEHYRQVRDVATYASMLSITPKYLNLIVGRMTGHTAKVIIDHFVVLQLKIALQHSDKSVKEVAWAFHFSDLSFFCRYFKQHLGMTPQQFRRAAQSMTKKK